METKTIVSNITQEDLVNLFSTALYGSDFFCANYDKSYYKNYVMDKDREDTFEDKIALMLLKGKAINIEDCYAEDCDDFYGTHPHRWIDLDGGSGFMSYEISLYDIRNGIQSAIDGTFKAEDEDEKNYARECAYGLITEDGSFDLSEAQALLQIIVFNEIIYG